MARNGFQPRRPAFVTSAGEPSERAFIFRIAMLR
jgi:hypothetical protein